MFCTCSAYVVPHTAWHCNSPSQDIERCTGCIVSCQSANRSAHHGNLFTTHCIFKTRHVLMSAISALQCGMPRRCEGSYTQFNLPLHLHYMHVLPLRTACSSCCAAIAKGQPCLQASLIPMVPLALGSMMT